MGIERRDFVVALGETFRPVIRWATPELVSTAISAISQTAPVVVTAVGHGTPAGWPVAVVSARGMLQINAPRFPPRAGDWHAATVMTADTVKLNDVNSADFSAYTSGGFLVRQKPVSLTGVTVRLVIRDAPLNGAILATLTEVVGITVDQTAFTISPRLETAALSWTVGYYDLEVTDPSTTITQVLTGTITIQ